MPKTKPKTIDREKIIAANPKIDAAELKKGLDALKKLYETGVVKQSTYSLETPERKKTIYYSDEDVQIRANLVIKPH